MRINSGLLILAYNPIFNKGVVQVANSRKFVAKTKDVSLTVRRAESF
ncbi:hypothetical protein HMPREF1585_00922 [Gardnerella vaginalis JCP8481B]|nr:hypothetical protein HMPREF1585_00922 [Gardnerella vaginalis JCP8481B]